MSISISTAIVLLFNIILFNHITLVFAECPQSLTDYGDGVCGMLYNVRLSYCEAHRACRDEGYKMGLRLVVMGMNLSKYKNHPSFNQFAFTSMNTLLIRDSNSRAGWRVGEPGQSRYVTSTDPEVPWHRSQPNNQNERAAMFYGGTIHDVTQISENTRVVCRWAGPESSLEIDTRTERFDARFPRALSNLFFPNAQNTGCFKQSGAPTLLACAKACKLTLECRSIYYNRDSKQCWLALYVDSLMPYERRNDPGTWVRFARPDW